MILPNILKELLADGRRRGDEFAPQIDGIVPILDKLFEGFFVLNRERCRRTNFSDLPFRPA